MSRHSPWQTEADRLVQKIVSEHPELDYTKVMGMAVENGLSYVYEAQRILSKARTLRHNLMFN